MTGNEFSYMTAKRRDRMSAPARWLHRAGLLRGRVLDLGCGYGRDTDDLRQMGVDIVGYDPHYRPERPEGLFDTIICIYVLNVLLPQEQAEVLMEISQWLRPGGRAYFAVRRDLTQEGYRLHAVGRQYTYQCNVRLPYTSLLLNKSFELYEYRPTALPDGHELVCETCSTIAWRNSDSTAVNIAPKRTMQSHEELTEREVLAMRIVIGFVARKMFNGHCRTTAHIAPNTSPVVTVSED